MFIWTSIYRSVLIFSFKNKEYSGPNPVNKIAKHNEKKSLIYFKNLFLFITSKFNKQFVKTKSKYVHIANL